MTTQLIPILNMDHLTHVMNHFQSLIVYFDNTADHQCQAFKSVLLKKCQEHKICVAALHTDINPDKSEVPTLNIVQNGQAIKTLFGFDLKEIWNEITLYF